MTRHALLEELSPLPPATDELDLVGQAFHSSRNLCMSVRGYAELIQTHPDALDRHGEWAGKIIRQLDRLSDLYSNVERVWAPPGATPRRLPLAILLRSAERVVRQGLPDGQSSPTTRWDLDDDGWIRGHGPDLVRALVAVVENAFEAAPEGTEVVLRSRTASKTGWHVEIIDKGPGIPVETESRVCEPFFSRKPGHVGLGLYLSRTIFERHGCSLRFRSGPASGTCAVITPSEHSPGGDR